MLVTLAPMFDKEMKVSAYSLLAQKDNYFLNPELTGIERHAQATKIVGAEVLREIDIETLSPDTDLFLPLSKIALFKDIASLCDVPHERMVLLVEDEIPADEAYIGRLMELKKLGYKLALKNLPVTSYIDHASVIRLLDYVFLDSTQMDVKKAKIFFEKSYPKLKLVISNIVSEEYFELIKNEKPFVLFEGPFYRIPVTKGEHEVTPLKATYLQLLNVVNDDDFELTQAADIIGRDAALTISFLKMAGSQLGGSEISSIRHATAILGQKELKKWINAVVTKELCADRPSEVMRVSMLRARFAEELAPTFEMATSTQELFLVGLFSILDQILQCPMSEALEKVKVSKEIKDALVERKGRFAKVLDFILNYEAGNWQAVSRLMIVENLDMDEIYKAYVNSLRWFSELIRK